MSWAAGRVPGQGTKYAGCLTFPRQAESEAGSPLGRGETEAQAQMTCPRPLGWPAAMPGLDQARVTPPASWTPVRAALPFSGRQQVANV